MIIIGTVKNTDGQPLAFANVFFSDTAGKPSTQGTITGISGSFTLEGEGAFVTASYVGHTPQTQLAALRLDFKLAAGKTLEEVNIVGIMDKKSWKTIALAAAGFVIFIYLMKKFVFHS